MNSRVAWADFKSGVGDVGLGPDGSPAGSRVLTSGQEATSIRILLRAYTQVLTLGANGLSLAPHVVLRFSGRR